MDLTQLLGIVSFSAAGLLCLSMRQSPWMAIGFVNLMYCLECVFGFRHRFHDAVVAEMGVTYLERAPLQIVLTGSGLLLACILAATLLRLNHSRSARIAIVVTTFGGTLFAVEAISLHEIDQILYRPVGAALLIAWVWLSLAIAISSAATISKLRGQKI